jgi:hypothetical protein
MMLAIAEKVLAMAANKMKVFGTVRSRGRSEKEVNTAMTAHRDKEPPTRSRIARVRT